MKSLELEKKLVDYPQPLVVMGIGLPGAHKSSLLRSLEYVNDLPAIHLNYARVREMTPSREWRAYEPDNEIREAKIRRQMHRIAGSFLNEGQGVSIIYDADNTDPFQRRDDIDMFRNEFGAKALVGVLFSRNEEAALSQLLSSKGHTQLKISQFHEASRLLRDHPPAINEGFDEVIHVDTSNGVKIVG